MNLPKENLLDLGNQKVVDFPKGEERTRGAAPLKLVLCEYCELLQLRHTVDQDTLFKKFWYRSGINEQMRAALKDVVDSATYRVRFSTGDHVADIGANDGTLLGFYPDEVVKHAYEPAIELAKDIKGKNTLVYPKYFEADVANRFKVVTAIAMFYDLEDPGKFLKDVHKVLKENGVFIVQMNYLPMMLQNLAFDNIGHEHLCYYSLKVLDTLFKENGLVITEAEMNGVNGGSIRVYARKKYDGVKQEPSFWEMYGAEDLTVDHYKAFANRVEETCALLKSTLWQLRSRGKRVYAYGASTRGSTMLQTMFKTGNSLDYLYGVAERDENKIGRTMDGVNLPIVSEEKARADADYFLVLCYHFWESISKREYEWMANGGKFILPVPRTRVYALENIGGKLVLCGRDLPQELELTVGNGQTTV